MLRRVYSGGDVAGQAAVPGDLDAEPDREDHHVPALHQRRGHPQHQVPLRRLHPPESEHSALYMYVVTSTIRTVAKTRHYVQKTLVQNLN